MKIHFRILLHITFVLCSGLVHSQSTIGIGTWRLHISYNDVHTIATAQDAIYGASNMGIVVFNTKDQSLQTYNKLNGLSGASITTIGTDHATGMLIVSYEDGDIDLITSGTVVNFPVLKELNTITGSRKINDIETGGGFAYLSADYGVVVFDIARKTIRETWRDLGEEGKNLVIHQAVVSGDSIILATAGGLLTGQLSDNLLDFARWNRLLTSKNVSSVAVFGQTTYAAVAGEGIYRIEDGAAILTDILPGTSVHTLEAQESTLLIASETSAWRYSSTGVLSEIVSPLISAPRTITADAGGRLWIGDSFNGLVSDAGGAFSSYIPNGPSSRQPGRLVYENGNIFALQRGAQPSGSNLYDIFSSGTWSRQTAVVHDITDIATLTGERYIASFGEGLERGDLPGKIVYDATNSPLMPAGAGPGEVFVSDIVRAGNGLWVANYSSDNPLHLFDGTNWNSYAATFLPARYPLRIQPDAFGNVWMASDPARGGGLIIIDTKTGENFLRTNEPGLGGLPHRNVRSLALDRDGSMWVGTDEGVAYFFSASEDAVRPIFENRFLLRDETIVAIAVDGGNRKWMATGEGAWLFSPSGEELVHHFTEENSPLPSNNVLDIAIDPASGEVFFSTERGIASYRADATEGGEDFRIRIFPNPVTSTFAGAVGISGLATDAEVRITDITGKLIASMTAHGGTATWNVRNMRGSRVGTGVYLVFAATADGTEREVGKIAVIE